MRQLFHLLLQAVTIALVVLLCFTLARGDSLGPHAAFAASRGVAAGAPELKAVEPESRRSGTPHYMAPEQIIDRDTKPDNASAALPRSVAICSPDRPDLCTEVSDCAGALPDGTRWACVRPWWAQGVREPIKVCAIEWADAKRGRDRTRAELGLVVRTQCKGDGCRPEPLTRWLGALALRESSLRPWVTHRLSGDERANASAWAKMRARYVGNPHYADAGRWRGRGMLGQIAAFHVHTIDRMAAPEELCDVSFATISYLQRSRSAAIKQASLELRPTWASVAAAVGTGAIRPSSRALELVRVRLRRAGVDPDARVGASDFGRPLPGGAGKGGWAAVTAARSVVAAARANRG